MILKNGTAYIHGAFTKKDIMIQKEYIHSLLPCQWSTTSKKQDNVIDCSNRYILPGCIDIHTHGCKGYDFNHASLHEIEEMRKEYAKQGVTSILATTMTIDFKTHKKAMEVIHQSMTHGYQGSRILGIRMEGPFFSTSHKGAHDEAYLSPINESMFLELLHTAKGNIKILDVDPTLDGAMEFIEKYSTQVVISLAHTSSTYETAMNAFHHGARHVTHLFNGMNGLHHREPGLVGAFSDSPSHVHGEIICDGIHIHPSVIRLMYKSMARNIILISDSMCAAGLSDGEYQLGGQNVMVKDGRATLSSGTIAGSTISVYEGMKRAISYGIPVEEAILSSTYLPAKAIHMEHMVGSIAPGLLADIIITDENFNITDIIINGTLMTPNVFTN